jgi:hypothetical protein
MEILEVGDHVARTVVLITIESFTWIAYHTIIVYFLSIPVPRTSKEGSLPQNFNAEDSTEVAQEADDFELVDSSRTREPQVDDQSRWDQIVLQDAAKYYGGRNRVSMPPMPAGVQWNMLRSLDSNAPAIVRVSDLNDTPHPSRQSFGVENDFGKT